MSGSFAAGPWARWRRRRPLRTRLAVVASGAVALVVLTVCAAAFFLIRYQLNHQLELNLKQSATLATQQHRGEPPQVLSGECRYLAAPACSQIVPADPARDPGGGYLLPVSDGTRRVAADRGGDSAYYRDIELHGHPARMLTTHIGRTDHALQVALRSDPVERGVRRAAWLLGATGAAGVLLAGALGYWVSRTGLSPVARLTATAERIAATRDAGLRIELPPGPPERGDEITRLAASFNTMLEALEQSVTAQRRLVADASHELRTPLTALRTNTELLARADRLTDEQRDRAAGALQRQLREVTTLVNDLIELARDEEPAQLVERVRLDALAGHAVHAAREHWPSVSFSYEAEPGLAERTVAGVPARLSRMLSNLLDNAAKFSGAGGAVEVYFAERTGALELTVRDHGPGLAEEDLPHVFDRFYRSSAARTLPGSGLGLAMCRQIAQAHGATLTAERAEGGGALFRVRFAPSQKSEGPQKTGGSV
ncbi:HAMP domain-containing sensor histidine kinase [Streptomyces sp. ODS28]|uniref:HAMP domain-containing sensor histidine kinase n=1 Tax=Streptomyces sp. ODS28 TaxID=3136688 RepID=UPI0031F0DBF5